MILDILNLLIGLPCWACLQALFAVLLPAKTWQIRRLQSYLLLVTGSGLFFVFLGGLFLWLRGPIYVVLISAVLGYVLLLLGGELGRRIEKASKNLSNTSEAIVGTPEKR